MSTTTANNNGTGTFWGPIESYLNKIESTPVQGSAGSLGSFNQGSKTIGASGGGPSTFTNIAGMIQTLGSTSFHWDVGFFIIGMLFIMAATMRSDVVVTQAARAAQSVPAVAVA